MTPVLTMRGMVSFNSRLREEATPTQQYPAGVRERFNSRLREEATGFHGAVR